MFRWVAALAVASGALAAPGVAHGATWMYVQSGVLHIADDPGVHDSSVSVSYGGDAASGQARYFGSIGNSLPVAGPGCVITTPSEIACDPSGVTQVVADMLEGNDGVDVRGVPAAVILRGGVGNDVLRADADHHAVTLDGGPGDDRLAGGASATAVTMIGSDGADTGTYDPVGDADQLGEPIPVIATHAVKFSGGAGDDRFTGGPGYDGAIDASGGAGDDDLRVVNSRGAIRLDGGAGDDVLALGDDDPDSPHPRGGHGVLTGGPGDDTFITGPDGDRDRVACGPGSDTIRFNDLMHRSPPLEDAYTRDCPPVGVKIARSGTISGRTARVTITAPRAVVFEALLVDAAHRERAGVTHPELHLRRGATTVAFTLTRRAASRLHAGRHVRWLVVAGLANRAHPVRDAIELRGGTTLTARQAARARSASPVISAAMNAASSPTPPTKCERRRRWKRRPSA
jgi:hypothetical protein